MHPLFPSLVEPADREAIRADGTALSYRQLATAAASVATLLTGHHRVAVWATSSMDACVGVVGALLAGVPVVPINPKAGDRDLAHMLADSTPDAVLASRGDALPGALGDLPRIEVQLEIGDGRPAPRTAGTADEAAVSPSPACRPPEQPDDAPAVVIYTSGTTGPPKGVVLSRRAIAANLDALAGAWQWTAADVLVHALPLFHVHGLILGVLGPLRVGGAVRLHRRFDVAAVAADLDGGATMLFGVPTMYHRLALEAEADPAVAAALGRARLLVSGSAALLTSDHERLRRLTGQEVVERYGLTETLIDCAMPAAGVARRAGVVGPPLPGVEVRLVADDGSVVAGGDHDTVGEVQVRGPSLFLEYLNRPDATAAAFQDGWFRTGDAAAREEDGCLRILGRRSTDIIKTGGFKVGAGEVENALLEHPAVAEAAVTGEADPDLGERIVAWVVLAGTDRPGLDELADHVARLLAPHKRPRALHYLPELPRNALGKVRKTELRGATA
jgi:malonyl-CoA/methylmalonyl-CoA synthetase